MTRDDTIDLFALSVRGELARAFMRSGMTPSPEEWHMLSGVREITMRDIGAIAFKCGFTASITFMERNDGEG